MSQFNLNGKGKQIIILASITGLAVAGNNGLVSQLASFLDGAVVSSVQAQTIRSVSPERVKRAVELNSVLREFRANSIAIQGERAIVLFDGGRQMPLRDGIYRNDSLVFTVENGVVTNCDGCGDDGDDEPFWLQHCPSGSPCPPVPGEEPDEPLWLQHCPSGSPCPPVPGEETDRLRMNDVRDSFNRVNPTNPNRAVPHIRPELSPNRDIRKIQPEGGGDDLF